MERGEPSYTVGGNANWCSHLEINGNGIYQNLWDAAIAVLREQFIVIDAYLKKQEKSQINNLPLYCKEFKKKIAKK